MKLAIESSPVMLSRPCSFCLCLQAGSVFADFDTNENDIVTLCRISFDGFGCCNVQELTSQMSQEDSRALLDFISLRHSETFQVEAALRRYFSENTKVIWQDALAHHELLEVHPLSVSRTKTGR
jgi:hypothetical protein